MSDTQNRIELKAYAKINLGLDVTGRLPNGYHLVRMVMQTVGIWDELILERGGSGITLTCDAPGLSVGGDNLVCRAVRLIAERYGITQGVRIHLKKRIPVAAGMAGGSADAAAALKGMNRLFGLNCTEEKLRELGVMLGADVPYCILGGTALAEGIGEKLTALPPAPDCALLVAKPDIDVSTGYVYGQLDRLESYAHPDIDGMVRAIEEGSLRGVTERMGNVLEEVTAAAHPVVGVIRERMLALGAEGSMMSGSGPSVFGIFSHRERAEAALHRMEEEKLGGQMFLTHFV